MRTAASAVVCAAISLPLIAGCGQSTQTTTVPPPRLAAAGASTQSAPQLATHTQPAGAAATKPTTDHAAAQLPAQHLLTHPTRRPPDVSDQFEFVGGAGPSACMDIGAKPGVRVLAEPFASDPSHAPLMMSSGMVTYGQPVDICFDGAGRGPLSVVVHGPDGFLRSGVFAPLPASYSDGSGWEAFDWVPAIEPSWPLGVYTVTARAGAIHMRHTFTVVAPSEPGIRVFGPSTDWGHNNVRANSRAKLFLTGFQHVSSIRLVVYSMAEGNYARFFSTAVVPIPPSGNTMIEVPTGPGSAREGYEPGFVFTTRLHGVTLFAAFNVTTKEYVFASLAFGALPSFKSAVR